MNATVNNSGSVAIRLKAAQDGSRARPLSGSTTYMARSSPIPPRTAAPKKAARSLQISATAPPAPVDATRAAPVMKFAVPIAFPVSSDRRKDMNRTDTATQPAAPTPVAVRPARSVEVFSEKPIRAAPPVVAARPATARRFRLPRRSAATPMGMRNRSCGTAYEATTMSTEERLAPSDLAKTGRTGTYSAARGPEEER